MTRNRGIEAGKMMLGMIRDVGYVALLVMLVVVPAVAVLAAVIDRAIVRRRSMRSGLSDNTRRGFPVMPVSHPSPLPKEKQRSDKPSVSA